MAQFPQLNKIGIQLFSLPKLLEQDFEQAIQLLSQMGYTEVELFGPYPFSTEAAQKMWSAITPMLGFSGSGYFGLDPEQVKEILAQNQITVPSVHTDLDTLESKMRDLGQAGEIFGFKYVGLPAIPDNRRTNLDDYKRMADTFNKIGAEAKEHGLAFAYHNHGYGWAEVDGQIPIKVLLDNTDPELVFLEIDIFWTAAAGIDPIDYLKDYSGRFRLMHVKDMKRGIHFFRRWGRCGSMDAALSTHVFCRQGCL